MTLNVYFFPGSEQYLNHIKAMLDKVSIRDHETVFHSCYRVERSAQRKAL